MEPQPESGHGLPPKPSELSQTVRDMAVGCARSISAGLGYCALGSILHPLRRHIEREGRGF